MPALNFVFGVTPYTPPSFNNVIFIFGDTGGSGNVYSFELSDSFAFNDDLTTGVTMDIVQLLDGYAFNDILNYQKTLQENLIDSFGFNETFTSKDLVVCWSCRTKKVQMGFGDNQYGEKGYGDDIVTDITGYILIIKNQSGTIIRREDIPILDIENPNIIYFYSMATNISDNGIWQQHLTFEVCQVNKDGILSEFKTVST